MLHPKIAAALIAALAAAVVTVSNAVFDIYPGNALVQLLLPVIPVIVGFLKKAEAAEEGKDNTPDA